MLAGLAIQFGIIGDVGMAAEGIGAGAVVSGTCHQSIASVLASLDTALNQSEPVAEVCVNARRKTAHQSSSTAFSETVFRIMGMYQEGVCRLISLSLIGQLKPNHVY